MLIVINLLYNIFLYEKKTPANIFDINKERNNEGKNELMLLELCITHVI